MREELETAISDRDANANELTRVEIELEAQTVELRSLQAKYAEAMDLKGGDELESIAAKMSDLAATLADDVASRLNAAILVDRTVAEEAAAAVRELSSTFQERARSEKEILAQLLARDSISRNSAKEALEGAWRDAEEATTKSDDFTNLNNPQMRAVNSALASMKTLLTRFFETRISGSGEN